MYYTIISKKPIPFIYQNRVMKNGQYFPVGEGILIHGGSGVVGGIDRDSGRPHCEHGIAIPEGIATVITEEQYNTLQSNKKFLHDVKRGVMKVLKGKVTDQSRVDAETHDMLDNDLIPNRPFDVETIEQAGGKINRDGSLNLTEAADSIEEVRRQNAGQMAYVKKRNAEERQAKRRAKTRKA